MTTADSDAGEIYSAQILADNPLGSIVRSASGGPAYVEESRLVDSFVLPVVAGEITGLSTGLAIRNADLAGRVKLTLHTTGESGQVADIGHTEIELPANQFAEISLHEAFPEFDASNGTLVAEGCLMSANRTCSKADSRGFQDPCL